MSPKFTASSLAGRSFNRKSTSRSERSRSEHQPRDKGVVASRSRSFDSTNRTRSKSRSTKTSREGSKAISRSHFNEADRPKDCVCGPNIYGSLLGPTVDEQILASLAALFQMCDECPPDYEEISDSETEQSQLEEQEEKNEEKVEEKQLSETESLSKEAILQSVREEESNISPSLSSSFSPPPSSEMQPTQSGLSRSVEQADGSSMSRTISTGVVSNRSPTIESPSAGASQGQSVEKPESFIPSSSVASKEFADAESGTEIKETKESSAITVNTDTSGSQTQQPSVKSSQLQTEPAESVPKPVSNYPPIAGESETSTDQSCRCKSTRNLCYCSGKPVETPTTIICVPSAMLHHSIDKSDHLINTPHQHNGGKPPHQPHVSQETSSRQAPHQRHHDDISHHHHETSSHRSHHSTHQGSEHQASPHHQDSLRHHHETHHLHQESDHHSHHHGEKHHDLDLKSHSSHESRHSKFHEGDQHKHDSRPHSSFHPSRRKGGLDDKPLDRCDCCPCNASSTTTSSLSGHKKTSGSKRIRSDEGESETSETKESSTSYTCVAGCPAAKSSSSFSCQFDTGKTRESSTSSTTLQCKSKVKKSTSKKICCCCKKAKPKNAVSATCPYKKVAVCCCNVSTTTSTTTTTSDATATQSAKREQAGDGKSSEVRYAITKITKFSSYTTFEVMKSTRNKPKVMPTKLEGVFVLRNKK